MVLGTMVAAALLASCGGGKQVEAFAPVRVVSFGDESSVLDDSDSPGNARKYSVNYVDSTTLVRNCEFSPLWVQYLTQQYGVPSAECNSGNVTNPPSRNFAAVGSGVADVQSQIDQFLASDRFSGKDLVTIMVGANDILTRYKAYPAISEAQATAEVEQLGVQLAQQVNRIADLGGKVLISTVVDLGLTPFAANERVTHTDANFDRATYLSNLVRRFNAKLRLNVLNDGRKVGLLLTDELIQTVVRFPQTPNLTLTDVSNAVCDIDRAPDVRNCTTATLIPNGSGDTFLWADDIHLSAGGQRLLGELASTRAIHNPF